MYVWPETGDALPKRQIFSYVKYAQTEIPW